MRDYTIIVSGHPRSGTSVAMQMLYAGGIEVVASDRKDSFNPQGYFEIPHDGIPGIKPGAEELVRFGIGKAMKVTAASLSLLKCVNSPMKIIFMNRDIETCARSFEKLNIHRGLRPVDKETVRRVTEFGRRTANEITPYVLDLVYEDIIESPNKAATMIKDLIGEPFDILKASNAVLRGVTHA